MIQHLTNITRVRWTYKMSQDHLYQIHLNSVKTSKVMYCKSLLICKELNYVYNFARLQTHQSSHKCEKTRMGQYLINDKLPFHIHH